MADTNSIYKKVKMVLISLSNSVDDSTSLQTVRNFNELSAPLTALMNNREGNTRTADALNASNPIGDNYRYIQIRPSKQCVCDFIPILPLGWQISDFALDAMKKTLDSNKKDLDSVLKLIEQP